MDKQVISELIDTILLDWKDSDQETFVEEADITALNKNLELFKNYIFSADEEIKGLLTNNKKYDAAELCETLINQCTRFLFLSDENPLEDDLVSLINYYFDVLYKLIKDTNDDILINNFMSWLLKETRLKQYSKPKTLKILIDYYQKLFLVPPFVKAAETKIEVSDKAEPTALATFKLIFYFQSNEIENIEKIVSVNPTSDELHITYILYLIKENRIQDAIIHSKKRFIYTNESVPYGYYNLDNRQWYIRTLLELFIGSDRLVDTYDFVCKVFVTRDLYSRRFRVECFQLVAGKLNIDQRNCLLSKILNSEKITPLEIEETCLSVENWQALIGACRKISKITEIFWIVERNKNNLFNYPEELKGMLKHVIYIYAEKDSGDELRLYSIIEGIRKIRTVEGGDKDAVELIFCLKSNFRKRRTLLTSLDKFINDNNLTDKYQDFIRLNS